MTKYSGILSPSNIPQSCPLTPEQILNNQGGYSFAVDKWVRLERFLILGSESGTYYAKAQKLTQENATNVIECIKEDGGRVLALLGDISRNGKAPKNDAAIFALALILTHSTNETVKLCAYIAMPTIARTGTHLFQFVEDVNAMRGWSRGLRKAVSNWYLNKDYEALEYQMLKYKQRNGWSHRDVLRLAHPKTKDAKINALFNLATKGFYCDKDLSLKTIVVQALPSVSKMDRGAFAVQAIKDHGLTREMLPTECLNSKEVWAALLEKMPLHALVRNLAKMTNVGLLESNLSDGTRTVFEKLSNKEHIRKSRLHPITILNALRVYAQGKGEKGKLTWVPVDAVKAALQNAFYHSFENVETTGKRLMLGLDISGSMDGNMIAGTSLDARMACAALALITANREPFHEFVCFSTSLIKAQIPKGIPLEQLIHEMKNIQMGGTDCALPIIYALQHKIPVDCFIIYTDNETAHGRVHPAQALKDYRKAMGIPAKMIVVGMCSNGFSIADPNDKGMLDIVGFSPDVPALIHNFIKEGE